ncbi:hypothetical protein J6590_042855 [Homalodisca vitripennis]|nr:hypothetical protein J6590_042855 [Homalodisca vitripennis]
MGERSGSPLYLPSVFVFSFHLGRKVAPTPSSQVDFTPLCLRPPPFVTDITFTVTGLLCARVASLCYRTRNEGDCNDDFYVKTKKERNSPTRTSEKESILQDVELQVGRAGSWIANNTRRSGLTILLSISTNINFNNVLRFLGGELTSGGLQFSATRLNPRPGRPFWQW